MPSLKFKSAKSRNAAFARMTTVERRHAVARDALALMRVKGIVPTKCVYLRVDADFVQTPTSASVEAATASFRECNCCQVGLMLLSYVRLFDGAEWRAYDMHGTLETIYNETSVTLMEEFFEDMCAVDLGGTPAQRMEAVPRAILAHPRGQFTLTGGRRELAALTAKTPYRPEKPKPKGDLDAR